MTKAITISVQFTVQLSPGIPNCFLGGVYSLSHSDMSQCVKTVKKSHCRQDESKKDIPIFEKTGDFWDFFQTMFSTQSEYYVILFSINGIKEKHVTFLVLYFHVYVTKK